MFCQMTIVLQLISAQQPNVATLPTTFSLLSVDGIKTAFQNSIPVPSFEKQNSSFRTYYNLGGADWKKQRFIANHKLSMGNREPTNLQSIIEEAQGRESKEYDDGNWERTSIPSVENDWVNSVPQIHYESSRFNGGVWYRKKFNFDFTEDIPINCRLKFYAVNYVCDVWLNNVYLGHHEGGYTPFAFDVSQSLISGAENVISVRVDNPPILDPEHPNPRNTILRYDLVPYNSYLDWFNYTGIIHDVFIEVSSTLSIVNSYVTPLNTNGEIKTRIVLYNSRYNGVARSVHLKTEIFAATINSFNVQSEFSSDLIEPNSTPVLINIQDILATEVNNIENQMYIPNPNLWTFCNSNNEFANLYVMKVSIIENNQTIDEFCTQFGIRKVRQSNQKLLVNDKFVFLTGVARHEDHPLYGRSIPKEIIYSDLRLIRDVLKSNWLRTAHYPNHPFTYLVADRLGMGVMEEIPVWSFNHQEAWDIQNVRKVHYQMFREMVFRDFNRPSILCWSLDNENSPNTIGQRIDYINFLKQEIQSEYPDDRLIGQASAAYWQECEQDATQNTCEYSGWNLYVPNSSKNSCKKELYKFLDDASIYNNPLIGTEYNGERNEINFNSRFHMLSSRAPMLESGEVNCNGFVNAVTYWIAFNFYSTSHDSCIYAHGYSTPYGLMNLDRTRNDGINHEIDALIRAYTPYFELGGTNIGVIPCRDLSESTNSEQKFMLNTNYPNPFNPKTKIFFSNNEMAKIQIVIYDILGRSVMTLKDHIMQAGMHYVEFDGTNLPSGVYFYEMIVDNKLIDSKKMVLLK